MAEKILPMMIDGLGFCSEYCPYCRQVTERESFYKFECSKADIRMGVSEVCQPWVQSLVEKLETVDRRFNCEVCGEHVGNPSVRSEGVDPSIGIL